jgi:hypothetical protein
LSGGPMVEAGRDPTDPAATANMVPRRRGKTLHLKKSRQSYPASGNPSKAGCADINLSESGQQSMSGTHSPAAVALPTKRRYVDERGGGVGGNGVEGKVVVVGQLPAAMETLEGHASSYV